MTEEHHAGMQDTPSKSQYTVTLASGQVFGPVTQEELVHWAREGRVPAEGMVQGPDMPPVAAGSLPWFAEARARAVPPRSPEGLGAGAPPPNAMDHVIPVRNGPALISWYLGVFSLIPFLGIPLGIAAIITGAIGLKKSKAANVKVGFWHGLLGMLLGILSTFGYTAIVILIIAFN
ncbi:MAG: hypothetical protein MK085_05795 [Phycisphaerales bacterium]|nr:hypothetical protein [Phycisphaerales bacterium]